MGIEPEYVVARRALLDSLTALEGHLDSLVLVGAQAVYHHTGDADLMVPLMTTDADLAINTDGLEESPEIGAAMRAAGFAAERNPGRWVNASEVAVDLMVVPHQSGTTKKAARSARIPPHEKKTARITRGLEPALVDNARVPIASFEREDPRSFPLRIAGPAALLTAKAIKLDERLQEADSEPDRVKGKDALDVYRILQAIDTADLVAGFDAHGAEERAEAVSAEALEIYREHASTADGQIAQLAASAAHGDPVIAPSFAVLIGDLLASIPRR